ncbi:hypothetical protein BT96DRAFT_867855 [Gymnopus androsaceus JB14]|uniref:Uncharacterized protein n=1 Tax=Gymnopus androsaceus JB14 TaxID=1447944 RepID=A0A6A4GN06_9AGAR|nr:hypothetical protein BT96DRAFT_867855 [Gymnopus androsaceus JB14]
MYLLILLLSIIRTGISLPTTLGAVNASDSQTDSDVSIRTTSGIAWSCITTIFACTWTAVHSEIPVYHASGSEVLWERVKTLVVALVAPELVVIWAINQRISAEHAVKALRQIPVCKDWTLTHGMFIVMNGFMLTDTSGKHIGVIKEVHLVHLLSAGLISFSNIPCSKAEIMDRSKADGLAKALALIQTIWFMAQVISRALQHLPITELEIATVAFVFLNFITYVTWQKKPFNVRYPILVPLLQNHIPEGKKEGQLHGMVLEQEVAGAEDTHPTSDRESARYLNRQTEDIEHWSSVVSDDVGINGSSIEQQPILGPRDTGFSTPRSPEVPTSSICAHASEAIPPKFPSALWFRTSLIRIFTELPRIGFLLIQSPVYAIWGLFETVLSDPLGRPISNLPEQSEEMKAIFCSSNIREDTHEDDTVLKLSIYGKFFIGALFGSIHCFAWSFQFPSTLEQILWRIMSLIITIAPLVLIVLLFFFYLMLSFKWKEDASDWENVTVLDVIYGLSFLGVSFVYVAARFSTFILAFLLLRHLPAGALDDVQWSKFIPHV